MNSNDIALVTGERGGIGRDMATLIDVAADTHIATETTTASPRCDHW